MKENRHERSGDTNFSPAPERTLVDNHGRRINYLRLSITDRCDLRCRYCCPETGVSQVSHDQILSYEELDRLVRIFVLLGVDKLRITGGEPFARKGLLTFVRMVKKIQGLKTLYLTTNGVKASQHLDVLFSSGIDGINLSLDTLDRSRYQQITRRDCLDDVLRTFHGALQRNIPIKVNSVVLEDSSDSELLELAGLCRQHPVTVRFIEKMPFSGAPQVSNNHSTSLYARLKTLLPAMVEEEQSQPSTARIFTVPGFHGKIGIIEGNSRHFCRSCNKVRVTPVGMLKTCLYDNGVLDLRELLRSGCDDTEIARQIHSCIQKSAVDGHAAEKLSSRKSEPCMQGIGG